MLEQKKVILYELNEVPWKVFDRFILLNPNSAVARLVSQGRCYESVAEDQGHLSPWVTWPTLHRGVTNANHGILDFGQDLSEVNEAYPAIWTQLANRGVKVGVFGSLHTYPLPCPIDGYAFYIPDTFAAGAECFPESLSAFQDFNLKAVQQSGRNVSRSFPRSEALRLMQAAPKLGMTAATLWSIVCQLAGERIRPERVCRRRTSQVVIAFDFFMRQLGDTLPDFATFFTNHVASSMHRYWPATFPEDYTKAKFAPAWRAKYVDEIDYTMTIANQQIGRLMSFAKEHGYVLCVASSMGQAAVDDGRSAIKTQLNIGNHRVFMAALGLEPGEWRSMLNMVPLYTYEVAPSAEERFVENIARLKINGKPLDVAKHGHGVYRVALGHPNLELNDIEILLDNRRPSLTDVGLINMRIDDEAGSNAYHVPDGSLIVYDSGDTARPNQGRPRISTVEISSAILKNFGVARPAYMAAAAQI